VSAELRRTISGRAATIVVVANMIGSGIFTSTGFQAAELGSPWLIYALWTVGGLLAFAGALCYAELGSAIPVVGGEYAYLRAAYGPSTAFMSAVASLTAGFSAPIASALKALARYLGYFVPALASDSHVLGRLTCGDLFAVAAVWLLIAFHARRTSLGIAFTSLFTVIKVAGILILVLAAIAVGHGDATQIVEPSHTLANKNGGALMSALATSLIFVMFCYSGWNAASYLTAEMHDPRRQLPRALLLGTGAVMAMYLALNAVYFYGAGVDGLAGKVEVGVIASGRLFGPVGAALTTGVLAVSLLASASAMTAVGPRVYYAAGQDNPALRFLGSIHATTGTPLASLVLQGAVTTLFIVLGTVDQIQQYAGLTLALFATLAVAAVFVLRVRRPELARPFRVPGYPFTPLAFIVVSVWTMFWALQSRPVESILSAATLALGGLLYRWSRSRTGTEGTAPRVDRVLPTSQPP
jgi:APA family basic amino acid/polyamine antiporter